MQKILFVTNSLEQCGVYQFGKATFGALTESSQYQFCYLECSKENGPAELLHALHKESPVGIIYNWHPETMHWLNDALFNQINKKMPKLKHIQIAHDYGMPYYWIDASIHINPNFRERKSHFSIGRLIPEYKQKWPPPENIIGSFGFGFHHKQYEKIIKQVNSEFNYATIRLHIPYSAYGDPEGRQAELIIENCKKICKSGIIIEANHKFLNHEALLDWLAGNSINCFFFDKCAGQGISSSIDWALAVKRPIAITNSCAFKHITKTYPSILIEQSSLKQIIKNGIRPLEKYYTQWTKKNFILDFERILTRVIPNSQQSSKKLHIKNSEKMEELATNKKKRVYTSSTFNDKNNLLSDLQKTLFVQQITIFVKKALRVLIIDKANILGPDFKKGDSKITIANPRIDVDFVYISSILFKELYDLIIYSSNINQCDNTPILMKQVYDMLPANTVALFSVNCKTADLKNLSTDCRLFLESRLIQFTGQLHDDSFFDLPDWNETIGSNSDAFCLLALKKNTEDCLLTTNLLPHDLFQKFAEEKSTTIRTYHNQILVLENHANHLEIELNRFKNLTTLQFINRKISLRLGLHFPKIYKFLQTCRNQLIKRAKSPIQKEILQP